MKRGSFLKEEEARGSKRTIEDGGSQRIFAAETFKIFSEADKRLLKFFSETSQRFLKDFFLKLLRGFSVVLRLLRGLLPSKEIAVLSANLQLRMEDANHVCKEVFRVKRCFLVEVCLTSVTRPYISVFIGSEETVEFVL